MKKILPGDPTPDFTCASTLRPDFHYNSIAGRYVVLSFFGSAAIEKNAKAIAFATNELKQHFDDVKVSFFGVSIDPTDQQAERVKQSVPGFRYFWDFDYAVSKLYGAVEENATPGEQVVYRPFTLVLDPNLRVLANISLNDPDEHNRILQQELKNLPPVDKYAGVPLHAPALIVPRVFEPEFCRKLIDLYEQHGGYESGSMREKDGYTVGAIDYNVKRRKDYKIEEMDIQNAIRARIIRRLLPEIFKAFQFRATRIERYIVACYESENQGFFRPHRDNTTKGTAHRQFACSINLNSEEFEGGNLRFPEFGQQTYRAPTGGAVVFSCSLLHEATPVTKGVRYATLPFLYDTQSEAIRNENLKFLKKDGIITDDRPDNAEPQPEIQTVNQ